jgi:hypothetical protein
MAAAPCRRDEHDLNLSSDHTWEIAPVTALALDPEQTVPSEDGKLNPATEAADPAALEPHTDPTSNKICVTETPDSSPATGSEPRASVPPELDRAPIIEFSSADIFRHSPLGDVLNSLKTLALAGDSQPNYIRFELEADDGEFCFPPTAHFIATVEDLTDMLDYDSEDIDGMDDDAGEEQAQNPPFTGRWTATSSYDVYMVDTPKENNGDNEKDPVNDKPLETQPKCRRQRHCSKSRRGKDSNTGARENNTPDDAKDKEDPVEPTSEQDDREDGQVSPDEQAINEDSEDSNYLPLSEDEVSLGDEDFIVPEKPVEQEGFKRRLIATARSLKKKQQQLQADQDLLNDRWTDVLAAEEYELECPIKSYPKRKLLPQFDDEALEPMPSTCNAAD